jgi:CBS domain-containing protein
LSFIVSFNGQFQPYDLPDLSRFDRVSRVYKTPVTHSTESEEERVDFPDTEAAKEKKTSPIQAYENVDAEFQKDRDAFYAKDLMSSPVHTIQDNKPIKDLEKLFDKYSIRHVPVLNDKGALVGIVSDRDLLQSKKRKVSLVKDVMASEVLTAMHNARILDIAKLMMHEKIGAMPVVNTTNSLIGIVTLTDILAAIVRQGGI